MKRSVSLLLNCALLLTLLAPTAVGVQARTDPQRPETEPMGRAVDAPPSLSGGEQLPLPQAHAPTPLQEAVRQGTFPAQLAGPSGSIRPDRYVIVACSGKCL